VVSTRTSSIRPATSEPNGKRSTSVPSAFLGSVGLSVPAGERGRGVLEQIWSRPTAEVNGVIGGYTGAGFKTVIASRASAKVSFRLVAGQDPDKVSAAFREFVRGRLPPDCRVTFIGHAGNPAISLPLDSGYIARAAAGTRRGMGRPAAVIGSGGSIPVVGDFKKILGMGSLMVGYGLDDDRVHSPNEKYDLTSFHKGIRSWRASSAPWPDEGNSENVNSEMVNSEVTGETSKGAC